MKEPKRIKWMIIARQAIVQKALEAKMQKNPLRAYTLKRLIEEGDNAGDLFEI
ncbi:MAG: hypothetical protein Q7S92_05325 [Candidatus Diapherotrites archaeon]|nr:hypothetical protein [Candidatus Diapherotrites archaeon]